jgi:hypothetical protein
MANGCDYWMVFLPDRCPDSFLLFVQDSQDRTSLRNFSFGRAYRLPESLTVREMSRQTTEGITRFHIHNAEIRPKEDIAHWQELTLRYNALLAKTPSKPEPLPAPSQQTPVPPGTRAVARVKSGRALRGSQRQLQDYVNLHESRLTQTLLAALPEPLHHATIEWVSPRADKDYVEFQDYGFLAAIGLGAFARELRGFWPPGGPCWDALGILRTGAPNSLALAILVEAKSHIPEVRSSGCQASPQSLALIQRSLEEAKSWCGADPKADWTGPLYQSANRIAHLYLIRQKLNRPCLLVNLYFVDDPYRPTSLEEWRAAVQSIKDELGLTRPVPGLVDLFIPALGLSEDPVSAAIDFLSRTSTSAQPQAPPGPDSLSGGFPVMNAPAPSAKVQSTFAAWRDQWTLLASFDGPSLADADARIGTLLALWKLPIPGRWQREIDPQLLADRYRRGDRHAPHPGEHTIEHRILDAHFARVSCLGMSLVDGVNAFPLSCDFSGAGRRANVEADMLLLGRSDDRFRFFLCEVKDGANDPWYAAVELLRQMKLFLENPWARQTMVLRGSLPQDAAQAPVTGLVLAPRAYYLASGKKQNALAAARKLLHTFNKAYETDLRLATWEESLYQIDELG